MLWADEDDALFFDPFGKTRVFAQKPIARMHRLCAGLFAGSNNFVGYQVTLTAGSRANVDSLIRQFDMAGVFVSIGVNRHGLDAHLFCGDDDAAGYFAAVGDQYFGEHGDSSFSINTINSGHQWPWAAMAFIRSWA